MTNQPGAAEAHRGAGPRWPEQELPKAGRSRMHPHCHWVSVNLLPGKAETRKGMYKPGTPSPLGEVGGRKARGVDPTLPPHLSMRL